MCTHIRLQDAASIVLYQIQRSQLNLNKLLAIKKTCIYLDNCMIGVNLVYRQVHRSGTDNRRGEGAYNPLHCYRQNDFRIKMGSDVSHFNIS